MVGEFLLNQINRIFADGRPEESAIKGDMTSMEWHSLETGLLISKMDYCQNWSTIQACQGRCQNQDLIQRGLRSLVKEKVFINNYSKF